MQRSKKILFVTPPYHCGVVEVAGRWVPATLAYLAGAVREAGFAPVIHDAMTKQQGFREIEQRIREERPAYVAVSAITSTAPDALEVLKTAKHVDAGIITIIGGVHPTFLPNEILLYGHVDYVVRGEGEETLTDLLLTLNADMNPSDVRGIAFRQGHRVVLTPERGFIRDLDALRPAWDLLEWKDYRYFVMPGSRLGSISTSRGCSHACAFCSQQKFWKQSWRGRKPERVVQEIELLHGDFGVDVFLIPDEYPTLERARWEAILDLLIEKNLGISLLMETRAEDIVRDRDILHKYRQAGIVHIYIGIEATDQETLDRIKKDVSTDIGREAIRLIREHGMISETSFILGFPHETKQSIARTLELSKAYNPDFAHYLALAPWPYAEMYRDLQPSIVSCDYRHYNLIDPVIKPAAMEIRDLDRAIIDCYQSFYMGKMAEIVSLRDGFRKDYLLRSMKLMMASSFIREKLGKLGVIPPQVKTLLRSVEASGDGAAPGEGFVRLARRSISISAPVDEVFVTVADPGRWPEFIPGLGKITGLSARSLAAGSTFDWTYRIKGFSVKGTGTVVEYRQDDRLTLRMNSLVPIQKTILFEEHQSGTLLTVDVGCHSPGKVLSLVFTLIRKSLNTMEAKSVLERVKAVCERTSGDVERSEPRCPVRRWL
ncbi:MAG: hypothetical protein OHK006_05940 [Thermodesulfovibrionales bacterium]